MLGKGLGALKSGGNVTPLGAMVAFFFVISQDYVCQESV